MYLKYKAFSELTPDSEIRVHYQIDYDDLIAWAEKKVDETENELRFQRIMLKQTVRSVEEAISAKFLVDYCKAELVRQRALVEELEATLKRRQAKVIELKKEREGK